MLRFPPVLRGRPWLSTVCVYVCVPRHALQADDVVKSISTWLPKDDLGGEPSSAAVPPAACCMRAAQPCALSLSLADVCAAVAACDVLLRCTRVVPLLLCSFALPDRETLLHLQP